VAPRSCWRAGVTARAALASACAGSTQPAADTGIEDTWIEPLTGIAFVRLPAGHFDMGSAPDARGHEPGERRHAVTLSRPFYLQRTEVTQAQWLLVMGENPASFRQCGEDCPVESVNLHQVEGFLVELNRLTGESFRLPTEAEWEYGCRAGGTAPPWPPAEPGADASDLANVDARYPMPGDSGGEFLGTPTPVGKYPANPWGLFDLHGNVWEWTASPHCPYSEGPAVDPQPSCDSPLRVIRGGSWTFDVASARCETRYTHRPQDSGFSLGFRLVWEGRPPPP
jgi:formylglycine-generating enzyme required for sulfatase activity